jgi:hypothetical protein
MERALRFLKRTSVNWGGVGNGVGVAEDDVVLGEGDAKGAVAATGVLTDGVWSCAERIDTDKIQAGNA